jgi:ribosomal protein S12 methylthiotransferase accessory factor
LPSAPRSAQEVSPKRYFLGTHRTHSPDQTWSRIAPLFERMGITRVADVTRLDHVGIPVFQSIRPASRNLSVSQGKGLTPAAARVSAAMESVEMWHAEDLDRVPQTTSSLQEMRYANPVPHEKLRWMFGARPLWSHPIRWVEAKSLSEDRSGWLPRDMMELDFTASEVFQPQMFVRNSNGLASGNDIHEAILHGLCEVVERHAWSLAQEDSNRLVAIDAETVDSEHLQEIIALIRAANLKLGMYDITWQDGLPTAFVKLVAPDLPVVWHGSGCHTSPEVALSRALTEAAQSRLTFIAGARDDLVPLAKGARLHRSYDEFVEPEPARSFAEIKDDSSPSVDGDVTRVVERLTRLGYESFWIDLTHPDLGIPVASTFVPGLKEIHG